MKTVIKVNGMMCQHCKKAVTDGLAALEGVTSVEVDLDSKTATVEHDCEISLLVECIEDLGFDPEV